MDFLELIPIILAIFGSGSVIVVIIQNRYQKLQSLEEKLREERQKVYLEVLKPFFLLFKKPPNQAELFELMNSIEYRKATFELTLIGSDDVIRAFGDLMQHFYRSSDKDNPEKSDINESKKSLILTGNLLLNIRKDFGNKDTKLKEIDMLRHMITDLYKFEEYK